MVSTEYTEITETLERMTEITEDNKPRYFFMFNQKLKDVSVLFREVSGHCLVFSISSCLRVRNRF